MDASQFRKAAHAAVDEIIDYFDTLPDRNVLPDVQPGYIRPLLPTNAPEQPDSWPSIQDDISRVVMPGLTHWQSPNFMGFYPAMVSYPSILGEMYSAALSAPAFNWICSPACTELETVVMDWVCQAIGLPDTYLSKGQGGGVIQGSASEAVVTVMVAARDRALDRLSADLQGEEKQKRIDELRPKLVALGSEHAHSSTHKGSNIMGTRFRTVPAPSSAGFRVTAAALRKTLEECKRDGLIPYYFTTTLGSTATASVDEMDKIAELVSEEEWQNVWVHVDAAYAGSALVCPEYQHLLKGVEKFESFNFNMHKWMFTNFDASCLFIRHRIHLTSALSITPEYLRNELSDNGLVTDYRDWQIPLGRRFRALKVWFVLRTYGLEAIRAHIRRTVKLGEYFHGLLLTRPDLFKVLSGPVFALTVFTFIPPASFTASSQSVKHVQTSAVTDSAEAESHSNDFVPDHKASNAIANEATKEVYTRITAGRTLFLTSSVIEDIYAIRVVSSNEQAEEKYLKAAFDLFVKTADEVFAEIGARENGTNGSA